MTVQNTNTKNIYVGNGSTTVFPFTFYAMQDKPEYIKVYVTGTDGVDVLTDNYTIDMQAQNVTYPKNGSPLKQGEKITIARELPLLQDLNLVNQGPFFAEEIEKAFDRDVMLLQQTYERIGRALAMGISVDVNKFNPVIPLVPGMSFRVNDAGTALESTEDPARVLPLAQSTLNETIVAKNEAQGYSANADAKAEQAANDAMNAAISEANADNSAKMAKAWADGDGSPDGDTDRHSAKWWAEYGENAVKGIDESVIAATQKASEASDFAQASANSAQASLASADEAKASELAAKASETNTKISEASALQSASVSAQKASEASNFAGNAKSSEDNAKVSETNAAKSAEEALKAKEEVVAGQIQADWNETNTDSKAFIKNKPVIMKGASNTNAGTSGLVPAPSAGAKNRYLNAYGDFDEIDVPVKSVNGKIGDVVVDLPVGHICWSIEPNVPAGRLPALGATYNRALYADLWAWANSVGLVKSESEWQAIASANGGNCAYYSSGDGSTTFRVPSIKCWVKGANSVDEVGSYLKAGLPNIYDEFKITGTAVNTQPLTDGELDDITSLNGVLTPINTGISRKAIQESANAYTDMIDGIKIDASKASAVYGNSNTVQPPSIVGQWLIVAFGVAHNIGEADVANVMQAVETAQTSVKTVADKIAGISDYIIESYRNGTEWYEVYKSGKVRQGGEMPAQTEGNTTITLLKRMANNKYKALTTVYGSSQFQYAWGMCNTKTTSSFKCVVSDEGLNWEVEGQGA